MLYVLPMYCILLIVSILERSGMENGHPLAEASVSPKSSALAAGVGTRTQPVVEMVGPKNFVALGGNDLRIGYRLSSSTPPQLVPGAGVREDLSIQLTLSGEEDGDESWIATHKLPAPLQSSWQEVRFECGLIVRGGNYNVRLIEGTGAENDSDYRRVDIISNLTIRTLYPTIDFEVPHRLETYTTSVPVSFGLTKTLCKPKLPLPATRLTLTICKQPDAEECFRDFATILEDPLLRLEQEGRVTVMIGCHLWARNSTYRVQIREKPSIRNVIATSQSIKVDWSPGFGINFNRKSIIPCSGSVQAVVSYPQCILPGKDKIRVYGYESLPVPSFLAPKRFNYILEKQILPNHRRITFPCTAFPQRFSRYCFQYINTAEDDSVAIVLENCIPTFTLDTFSDGGWGSWSSWSLCSATCGGEGKRFRYRFCDSPAPSFGANVCQGNFIEEEPCDKLPDCGNTSTSMTIPPGEEGQEDGTDDNPRTPTRLQFLSGNVRSTLGCECGCLLYDLVPGFNYSLSVALSSNQSSCSDEDEEGHHNLKWVLHASGEENRIRFSVMEAEVGCLTLSFRDGNTTDSNLLGVIRTTMSFGMREDGGRGFHSLESTGASLSIAASETRLNCSASTFVYFIASYHIVPGHPVPQEYPKPSLLEWNAYEFWTFILLKFILTFFILIVLCSTFGGCASKVYSKYKYKELSWRDGDEEEDLMEGGGPQAGMEEDGSSLAHLEPPMTTTSRNTSITLMSFDYAYWKQVQTLRLKYFLLRPRVINLSTGRVRSFPTSPLGSQPARNPRKKNPTNSTEINPHKQKCKSESNLTQGSSHLDSSPLVRDGDEKKRVRIVGGSRVRGLSNCECIYEGLGGEDCDRSHRSFKPTNTHKSESRERSDKLRKETENLLRRKESERRRKRRERKGADTEKGGSRDVESGSEWSQSSDGGRDEGLNKSELSLHGITCLARSPVSPFTAGTEGRDDFDGDLDFEMDYYDYNVLNAGNIPGSFLGLEPAFVLWNSEMYPTPTAEHNPPFPDESEESFEMETSTTSGSAARLIHGPRKSNHHRLSTKETSLDTLKFVDEEGLEDDDDAATHVSDSIFDNENDTESYPHHNLLHAN